ncbi:MAG: hypothetical protein KDD73_07130 [Anaerolineales bacterium]|nr:hypothetical protein [Anaerolineales bacterium]MCB9129082.1 hypothetical protein [Ardenticatenales bacterium]MCB9172766.1 hypothetical protein [Ardenticatenales bacterium]
MSGAQPTASDVAKSFEGTALEGMCRAIVEAECALFAAGPAPIARAMHEALADALRQNEAQAVTSRESRSAFALASGAALQGDLSAVAMSSEGMRLCAEDLDMALRNELRMVIINVQGGVQSDVQFVRWASVGGYPMIVLTPDGPQSSYDLTRRAFQIAEHFCMPVIIMTELPTLEKRGRITPHPPRPLLFALTPTDHSNESCPYSRQIAEKLDPYREALEDVLLDAAAGDGPDTLVIAFGATRDAAHQAVVAARAAGKSVSLLLVRSLWPAPKLAIRQALQHAQRVVVVELNFGQYRREVERQLGPHGPQVIGVHRMDGEMIEAERIVAQCL